MHFAVQKEVLAKALKDVTSAIATRVVQPILSNVLVESLDSTTVRCVATDLDMAIETKITGVVYTPGSITLPGKKLLEIVAKLPSELVSFQVNKETFETAVTCQRSKFNITGLPSDDFPKLVDARSTEGFLMPADILRKSIVQTAFAAASYDASSILGGVYLVIENGAFECTATDGSRLAHRREQLNVTVPAARRSESTELEGEGKAAQTATLDKPVSVKAIIPARACAEVVKLIDSGKGTDSGKDVRLSVVSGQVVFETETHYISSRLISGEYPRYHELFPAEYKYLSNFRRDEINAAIDRVAVMSDERTHLIKIHFEGETMQISSNTPDIGRAQEEIPMRFEGQVLDVAINVKYMQDVFSRIGADECQLEMTGPLKPLIIKAVGDPNYKYLLMPVQAK